MTTNKDIARAGSDQDDGVTSRYRPFRCMTCGKVLSDEEILYSQNFCIECYPLGLSDFFLLQIDTWSENDEDKTGDID